MNSRNNDVTNGLSITRIETSDTISQFMEKCNNNFSNLLKFGGGTKGDDGEKGDQGVPTKPKVPIHVWKKGIEYKDESLTPDGGYKINSVRNDELSNVKYQEGHLIILENGHVYILVLKNIDNNNTLSPKFIFALQSYDPGSIVNGKNAYVHIAYANDTNGDGFIRDQDINKESIEENNTTTFILNRASTLSNSNDINMPYMGIYSDNNSISSNNYLTYTWVRIQGNEGPAGKNGEAGPQGEKGEKGDGYTGQPYTIDLEGDMSTISLDIDRTRLYDASNDYCECIVHAYYGNENVKINITNIDIILPEEYTYSGNTNTIVLKSDINSKVGKIEKEQQGYNAIIKFIPDETFVFPKKTIIFSIHIDTSIYDQDDGNTYNFVRDTIWMVKGIVSSFELEIHPQYRTIKLSESGEYYPEKLSVSVYKIEDAERTLFNLNENQSFTLLYKNYNVNAWSLYPDDGVDTKGVSCLEFKIVRYYNSIDPEKQEEIWDYEDVWVVADGKSTHYYHADLGSTESMMILTTGDKINIGTDDDGNPIYCAELRNESGYSITFEPKFYDGTEELEIKSVDIGPNSGEEYLGNGTFVRELIKEEIDGVIKYKLKVTRVPYNVDIIPMTFNVLAKCPVYDKLGNFMEYEFKNDSVYFNVYISTLSNTYTLVPTVSSYNTSTGKTGDTIGCSVFKNNVLIPTTEEDLNKNALNLKYIVHDGDTDVKVPVKYTEPLIYGKDDDVVKDDFTASDVAIEFILYYRGNEVVRSTVPLIKDGIDGEDGDCWQYIFCRSPKYPFTQTEISDPSKWKNDTNYKDSNSEYLGEQEDGYEDIEDDKKWYDDHKGVDSQYRYEYQAYRKWDKHKKCWGRYGEPTLYSNYSESGSGYSVILSNPIAVIPVGDNDWSVDENNNNQYDSTLVYLYNNTSDMSTNENINISLPVNNKYVSKGHFTIATENNINKVIFTPVVVDGKNKSIFNFESNKQYKLPITLTYSLGEDADNDNNVDKFESTVNWTLSPIKGLYDVEIFVDKRVVNISVSPKHTFKVGYYLISSNGGRKFVENHNVGNTNGCKIILTDDIEELKKGTPGIEVTDWQNATYDFVYDNGENRNCYVVLVDSNINIIDYTIITAVKDGIPGPQGSQGKSRVLFYLGSFKKGEATLTGTYVFGHLTDERCDYYIDYNGQAWMRIGKEDEDEDDNGVIGNLLGNDNDKNWKKSEKVGFLQANAIHADMINAGSLKASQAVIETIQATEINAEKITSGILNADRIDASGLSVSKLITKPDSGSSIQIENNLISVVNKDGYNVCSISDNPIIPDELEDSSSDENVEKVISFISPDDIYKTTSYEKTISDKNIKLNSDEYSAINVGDEFILYEKKNIRSIKNIDESFIDEPFSSDFNIPLKTVKVKIDTQFKLNTSQQLFPDIFTITIKPIVYITHTLSVSENIKKTVTIELNEKVESITADNGFYFKTSDFFRCDIPRIYGYYDSDEEQHKWYTIESSSFKIKFAIKIYYPNVSSGTISTTLTLNLTQTDFGYNGLNSCYTKLSDDGIIINNKSNGLLINDDCILLKFGKYGILLNDDGIQYSTNLNNHVSNILNANWSSLTS